MALGPDRILGLGRALPDGGIESAVADAADIHHDGAVLHLIKHWV